MIKESIFECPSIKALHPSSGSYMPAIATSDGDSRFFDPLTGKKATSISYNLHGAGANSYVIIREDAYWKQKSMHYFSSLTFYVTHAKLILSIEIIYSI